MALGRSGGFRRVCWVLLSVEKRWEGVQGNGQGCRGSTLCAGGVAGDR